MDPKSLVLQYLDEAHATETALVTTLTAHIAMAADGGYRRLLERHVRETRDQAAAIERRRAELGEDGGRGIVASGAGLVRDVVGQALVLTKGPIDAVRARGSAERMLKNAKDECATEALEIATYDALEAAAEAAGDAPTAKLARDHRKQEERMLADLRKEIPGLARAALEDRTDGAAAAAEQAKGRSAKATSGRSGRSTAKAGSSRAKSSTSSSRSKSSRSKSSASKSSASKSSASKSPAKGRSS